jgi:hypothetical protein
VDDAELSDLTSRVDSFLDALKDELQQVLQDTDADTGGDPLLAQLETLLAGRVTAPLDPQEWEDCVAEANRRVDAEEPPGYRDAEKRASESPDGAAGDYLIWYEATKYAKEQDLDLIIVTRDEKDEGRGSAPWSTWPEIVISITAPSTTRSTTRSPLAEPATSFSMLARRRR